MAAPAIKLLMACAGSAGASAHAALSAAIAALSPSYSWDATVASGDLPAIAGGADMVVTSTGSPVYQSAIGTDGLVGVTPNNNAWTATLAGLTDNQPFSFFCVLDLTSGSQLNANNCVIANTGLAGASAFDEGLLAMLLSDELSCYGLVAVSSAVRNAANESPTVRAGSCLTYLLVYTGSAINLYVNGTLASTIGYSGGVDHHGQLRLARSLANPTAQTSTLVSGAKLGYPAWWQNVALTGTDAAALHTASGL